MVVKIEKGARYQSHGRFRIPYVAKDGDVVVSENRASFNKEPDQKTEDVAFACILDRLENPLPEPPEPLMLEKAEVEGLTEKELADLVRLRTDWVVNPTVVVREP